METNYEVNVENGVFCYMNRIKINQHQVKYVRILNGYEIVTMKTGEEIKILGEEDKYNRHIYDEMNRFGYPANIRQ